MSLTGRDWWKTGVLNFTNRGPSVDSPKPTVADENLDSVRGRTFSCGVNCPGKWAGPAGTPFEGGAQAMAPLG